MTKKSVLVTWCVVAFLAGLVWVSSGQLSMIGSVIVLGLPVVLCALSAAWGE